MAQALGMRRVMIPACAGLFSSFGLLYADVEHHYGRTLRRLLRACDPGDVEEAWDALARQALEQLAAEGYAGERAVLRRIAALHYQGQTYELSVPLPDGRIDRKTLAYLEEAFGAEHERTYGHRAGPEEPVELVTIQVVGQGVRDGARVPERVRVSRPEPTPPPPRRAYFGPEHGWVQSPVMVRSALSCALAGPFIVEEYDATCVVPPGWTAQLDDAGTLRIDHVLSMP
jgi:N-methylhydantoinase A